MVNNITNESSITPSDPRVRMAAERTLLAWVRTGVAMMGFGFVVARFGWFLREFASREQQPVHGTGWSLGLGIGLIALGILVNVLSGVEHAKYLRRFDRGLPYQPPTWSLGIIVSLLLALLGMVMMAYLLTLPT
jgi:putative membrane protein